MFLWFSKKKNDKIESEPQRMYIKIEDKDSASEPIGNASEGTIEDEKEIEYVGYSAVTASIAKGLF